MGNDPELEIQGALRESQKHHTYFLLGAAGAAIALAVNQTASAALSWQQTPLAGAVLAWGLSFYFGCRNRAYVSSGLFTNATLFDVNAGRHPLVGSNPQAISLARTILLKNFEDQSNHADKFARLQFRFLIAGALLYVVWHVIEMSFRAN